MTRLPVLALAGVARVPALALAIALAGCATGPVLQPVSGPVPDLRGTWTGTWGGTPLTLLVLEQQDAAGSADGLYIGTYQVFGTHTPGVSGILTSVINGEPVSVSVQGRLGYVNEALTLVLGADAVDGRQQLALRGAGDDRLVGTGESSFRWGPRGPVELIRRAPPSAR